MDAPLLACCVFMTVVMREMFAQFDDPALGGALCVALVLAWGVILHVWPPRGGR